MNELRARLEELREMFYDGPKESTWWAVCVLFEHWEGPGRDVALDYALQQLDRWPDARRVAPIRWLKDDSADLGDTWDLVRAFSTDIGESREMIQRAVSRFMGPKRALNLLRSEKMARITHLSLPRGLESPFAALARSRYTGRLEHVELGSFQYGSDDIKALAGMAFGLGLKSLSISPGGQDSHTDLYEALANARALADLESLRVTGGFSEGDMGFIDLVQSPRFKNLKHLTLENSPIQTNGLDALLHSMDLPKLESLTFTGLAVGSEGALLLAESGHIDGLKSLAFTHNAALDEGGEALMTAASGAGLSSLVLSNNQLGDEMVIASVGHYPDAPDHLGLSANDLSDRSCAPLAEVEGLTRLDMARNAVRIRGLRDLLGTASIVRLDLSENRVGDVAMDPPEAEGGSLRTLLLRSNGLGDATIGFLGRCPQLRALETLDLSENAIGDRGVGALRPFEALRSLDLSFNKIKDGGVESLVTAFGPTLRHLSLAGNPIGLKGLEILVGSGMLEGLRSLDLRKMPIGRKGARLLASAPWSRQLEELKVSVELVGPVGLRHLQQSTQLSLSARANLLGRERGWEG